MSKIELDENSVELIVNLIPAATTIISYSVSLLQKLQDENYEIPKIEEIKDAVTTLQNMPDL